MKKITIKKIAELAGVSTATVSKVINNNGRYSEETRKKIMDIIAEHNYKPNAVAKSLRTSHSKTIGVIVPDITNEFFARIVLSIEKYCGPIGYSVFICNTDENADKELQYLKELELKGVDGLIFLSSSEALMKFKTSLPLVFLDRIPKNENTSSVTSDHYKGGYLAAKELIESGCKKPLLIRDFRNVMPTVHRTAGYESAVKEHGIKFDSSKDILYTEVGVEAVKEKLSIILSKGKFNYDGVFATTDGLAFGTKLALEEKGYQIPEDVKLVGFDNTLLTKYASITTIHQDKDMLGQKAAENLINMVEHGIFIKNQITLPVKLIQRTSTKVK